MELNELIKSKPYLDARGRVAGWENLLEKGGKQETLRVRDEKAEFFAKMQKSRPDLYEVFHLDDKTLSEKIRKNLTGDDIIID
jgi:hypothetical protein